MLPFAYQIIAALMNYERTVNDFGHCRGHAKNEYGISFVSHCVASKFNGPCPESRYPVPCGDETCRESYPACLLAMREIEVDAQREKAAKPTQLAKLFEASHMDESQLEQMFAKAGDGAVDMKKWLGKKHKHHGEDGAWTYDRGGRIAEM